MRRFGSVTAGNTSNGFRSRRGLGDVDLRFQRPMSYYDEARTRAARRKSPWNLALGATVLISWMTISLAVGFVLNVIHQAFYAGQSLSSHERVGTILVAVSSLFASLIPAMLVANLFVRLLPPARRALDREASTFPGTDFLEAQRRLLRIGAFVVPASLALGALGASLRWNSPDRASRPPAIGSAHSTNERGQSGH